jgi:hypothetical protein
VPGLAKELQGRGTVTVANLTQKECVATMAGRVSHLAICGSPQRRS